MEFKGTKGEWIITKEDKVMVLTEKGAYRPNSMFSYTASIKELEANAKLISAAPDLLEASLKMIDYYENGKVSSGISYLEEAINKALK